MAESEKNSAKKKCALWSVAYELIAQKIMTMEYGPGTPLEEKRLKDELGLGRTPIREALFQLSSDLLVESQPGKGFVVRPITFQEVKSVFEALEIMELGVAQLISRRNTEQCVKSMTSIHEEMVAAVEARSVEEMVKLNSKFHTFFAECSQNMYLIEGLNRVRCAADRLAFLSYGNEVPPHLSLKEHYAAVVEEHSEMIECIKNQDENGLVRVLLMHQKAFKDRLIEYLVSY